MNMSAFDTLAYSKRLRNAGFNEAQAEAVVEVVTLAIQSGVATKADVHELGHAIANLRTEFKREIVDLRTELKREIVDLRTELKQDIAGLRSELYRALLMQTFVIAGIMFVLLKLVG